MEELIPIQEHEGRQAVSARDLHTFLESKQQFTDWIKSRIDKYTFKENEEWVVFHNAMKNPNGGRPSVDYALTIDCAKQIAMVEGNEKGSLARQYFLDCEKKLMAGAKELSRKEILLMALKAEEEKERAIEAKAKADAEIARVEPMKQAYLHLMDSSAEYEIAVVAKMFKTGQKRFFSWLRGRKIIMTNSNLPYQPYIDKGWFSIKTKPINGRSISYAVVSNAGLSSLRSLYFGGGNNQYLISQ